jgi:hypothetical protein
MSSGTQGLLSLPSELLHEIIRICPGRERCRLRATCKSLRDHADLIVLRSLCITPSRPRVAEQRIIALEQQITALATLSSRAMNLPETWRFVTHQNAFNRVNSHGPTLGDATT